MFIEIYSAYSAKEKGKDDIEFSNNIILPASALQKLCQMKDFEDTKNPALFRILNIELYTFSHCGVEEFTAEEGKCYIPSNLFDRLCLEEGQKVNIRKLNLTSGTYVKLQPHRTEFINLPNVKTILEYNLRNYFCLTEGDTISAKFEKKIYKIDILECKPNKAIRTLNCDLKIDFEEPKDFKQYQEKNVNKSKFTTGNNVINLEKISDSTIIFKSEKIPVKVSKEEIKKNI